MTQNGDAFDVYRRPWSTCLGLDSTPDIILTTSKSHSFYPNIFSEVKRSSFIFKVPCTFCQRLEQNMILINSLISSLSLSINEFHKGNSTFEGNYAGDQKYWI